MRFFNFQRERQGEPPISVDYGRFREQLSEIYPDIEFKLADHRIVARVKSDVSGSLVERIGFVGREISHQATTVGFGFESLQVVFRADKVGVIKEDSYYEFFEHDLDLEEVRRDCEGDKDAIDEYLRDHFDEQISQQMEDPFFDPSGEGCELYFDVGSQGRTRTADEALHPDRAGHRSARGRRCSRIRRSGRDRSVSGK